MLTLYELTDSEATVSQGLSICFPLVLFILTGEIRTLTKSRFPRLRPRDIAESVRCTCKAGKGAGFRAGGSAGCEIFLKSEAWDIFMNTKVYETCIGRS